VFAGPVRVTLPEQYSIPAGGLKLFISGGYDDIGTVNGDPGDPTRCISGIMPNEITITSRVITFEAFDTAFGNVGIGACICVPNASATELPEIPETRFPSMSGGTISANGWTVEHPAYRPEYNVPPWTNSIRSCGPLFGNPLP
jgi:hypothetical protein